MNKLLLFIIVIIIGCSVYGCMRIKENLENLENPENPENPINAAVVLKTFPIYKKLYASAETINQHTFPYTLTIHVGKNNGLTELIILSSWWKRRPEIIRVYDASDNVIGSKMFPDYVGDICGTSGNSKCTNTSDDSAKTSLLKVPLIGKASTIKVEFDKLLSTTSKYFVIKGIKVKGYKIGTTLTTMEIANLCTPNTIKSTCGNVSGCQWNPSKKTCTEILSVSSKGAPYKMSSSDLLGYKATDLSSASILSGDSNGFMDIADNGLSASNQIEATHYGHRQKERQMNVNKISSGQALLYPMSKKSDPSVIIPGTTVIIFENGSSVPTNSYVMSGDIPSVKMASSMNDISGNTTGATIGTQAANGSTDATTNTTTKENSYSSYNNSTTPTTTANSRTTGMFSGYSQASSPFAANVSDPNPFVTTSPPSDKTDFGPVAFNTNTYVKR